MGGVLGCRRAEGEGPSKNTGRVGRILAGVLVVVGSRGQKWVFLEFWHYKNNERV